MSQLNGVHLLEHGDKRQKDRERMGHRDICDYTYVWDHRWLRKCSLGVRKQIFLDPRESDEG